MAGQFEAYVPSALQALMAGEQSFKEARSARMQNDTMAARQDAAQIMSTGGDPRSAIARLLGAGDVQGASTIASMGNNERDFAFREREAQRAQSNADRSYGLQKTQVDAALEGGKVPTGFTKTPTGLAPIPGGPEDPAYIRSKTDATDKGRNMSVGDITKLSEEGGKYAGLVRFANNFKDGYAGYGLSNVGGAAMYLGRNMPALVNKNTEEAATFWQDYDRYKNAVRHDLFGSALTATEQAQWDKADINPGQAPETIRKNLKIQKDVIEAGVKRKASAMIQQGYSPKVIGDAYGVDLGGIGVDTSGRRGGPQAAAPMSAPPQGAVEALRADPSLRQQFDQKYGAGASARALGQ